MRVAFVAIAHPHWYQLQIEDGEALRSADAVEVYNHASQVNADRGDGLVFYDAMLSRGHRLNCIAVDDSHIKVDDTFGGWVMVKSERNTPEAILAALKAGEFYSSQGPEIHQIAFEDDHVVIRCSPAETVMLLGPVSKNVRIHGRNLTSARLAFKDFANEWCRAVVVGQIRAQGLVKSTLVWVRLSTHTRSWSRRHFREENKCPEKMK